MSDIVPIKNVNLTYNLHTNMIRKTRMKRVPKAMKRMKEYIRQHVKADYIKVDPLLNKYCWNKGINKLPRKVRINVKLTTEETNSGSTVKIARATYIPVTSFKNLKSEKVVEEE